MRLSDIARPGINRSDNEEVRDLKRDAPKHLKELLNRSTLFSGMNLASLDVGDVQLLTGGVNAVAYLVRHHNEYVVVKFDRFTMKAEAEALEAWWRQGAKVVAVKSTGTSIYSKEQGGMRVRYVVLEGVTGSGNQPAIVAMDYAAKHRNQTEKIGHYMGRQLALMHRATTKRTFGEFADGREEGRPYRTWNAFLMGYLKYHHNNLVKAGYSEQRLKQLRRIIRETSFSRTGRYLHGDFSLRNALIESRNPLKVRIIDPNPLVGNPLWDIAIPWDNAEIAHRRASLLTGNKEVANEAKLRIDFWHGVNEGYRLNTKRRINADKLALIRVVQMIILLNIEIERAEKEGKGTEDDVEVIIRRNILSELMVKVLGS